MSDENNSGESGDNFDGDAGQQPQYVTQEALTEQFKALQDGLFSMVRKMSSQKPEPQKQEPQKAQKQDGNSNAEIADLRLESQFFRHVDKSLSKPQQDALLTLYKSANPEDGAVWIAEQSKLFASAPPTINTDPTGDPVKPPASNAGAPQATSAGESNPSDVTSWSQEEAERQFQLKAPVPHNRYDIRNREYHREIRRQAEKKMANTKISLGARKG